MLSTEMFKDDMIDWVLKFVSQYNEELGSMPCPFAKKAVLSNMTEYIVVESEEELREKAEQIANTGLPKPVVIFGVDPTLIDSKDFLKLRDYINDNYLINVGIRAMYDHPENEEIIAGVKMNQGTWAIMILQEQKELDEARAMLKKTNYYDKWTVEQMENMHK